MLSLLVAIAIGSVLYAALLAIGQAPTPSIAGRFEPPAASALPPPARLPTAPGFARKSMPNEGLVDATVLVALPIRIVDDTAGLRQTGAGVATFHSETGADFRWLPLQDAIPGQDTSLLVTGEARRGARITITLAASREHARHGYIARTEVRIDEQATRTAPIVTLSGTLHGVRFDLPAEAERAGPLRLHRVDDPQWLPMTHGTAGLTLHIGTETILSLGPGEYELSDPLTQEGTQRFRVPDAGVVEVSAALAKARGDRP